MTGERVAENSLRPMTYWRGSRHSSQWPAAFKEVNHVNDQTAGWGDEDGLSQDARGVNGNKHRRFLAILDNALAVSELARDEEQAGRPNPHPRDLLKGAGGGMKNLTAVDFTAALRKWYERCKKCVKIPGAHIKKK
jgi:hypothetical protein